jgi:hypothetical protein
MLKKKAGRLMKHKQYEEWLQLSLYHELSEQERTLLDNHIITCERCRKDLDELNKLHSALAHRKLVVVQEPLLQDARKNLRLRIHAESSEKLIWDKMKDTLDGIVTSPVQTALGGIAMVAIGILVGYFVFRESAENFLPIQQTASMETGDYQITNIRFIDRDTQTGNIEFTFETVTPVHIRGNVNEERIQKVLARALVSNQNVGTRLRAVSMIGIQREQRQNNFQKFDEEVKSALISALLHDKNLGVQKEALGVLRNYLPDPVVVRAFLQVLANEKNTGLKIAAINSLDLSQYENQPVGNEILEMFRNRIQSDDNNYIRIKAKTALQEVRQ